MDSFRSSKFVVGPLVPQVGAIPKQSRWRKFLAKSIHAKAHHEFDKHIARHFAGGQLAGLKAGFVCYFFLCSSGNVYKYYKWSLVLEPKLPMLCKSRCRNISRSCNNFSPEIVAASPMETCAEVLHNLTGMVPLPAQPGRAGSGQGSGQGAMQP